MRLCIMTAEALIAEIKYNK